MCTFLARYVLLINVQRFLGDNSAIGGEGGGELMHNVKE